MKSRPFSTLFLLTSLDGKISSGAGDHLDVDADWKRIVGVREGLNQYYALEQETDLFSLNSGKVWAKIGFNDRKDEPAKTPVTFIVVDNKPHLTTAGVLYAAKKAKNLIIVTENEHHPANEVKTSCDNISVLHYPGRIDLRNMMRKLNEIYGVDRITIQTGGALNAELLRAGLIDRVQIVVAPILVGGSETPSLIDGKSLVSTNELSSLKALKLRSNRTLENSYIVLEYDVISETTII